MRAASFSRLLAGLATVAVGVLMLIPLPAPVAGLGPPESDKVMHALLFGALVALWAWSLGAARWRPLLALAAVVALYGGVLELAQTMTPARSADWRDLAADAGGALAAAALWRLLVQARVRAPWS